MGLNVVLVYSLHTSRLIACRWFVFDNDNRSNNTPTIESLQFVNENIPGCLALLVSISYPLSEDVDDEHVVQMNKNDSYDFTTKKLVVHTIKLN